MKEKFNQLEKDKELNLSYLSPILDKVCSRCKRLFPSDMLNFNASRIETYGMSSTWGICRDCAEEYDNFD